MKQIYKKENRILLSMITGMMAVISLLCGIQWRGSQKNVLAWWGTLYPQFCFEMRISMAAIMKISIKQRPKLSFWLAKAIGEVVRLSICSERLWLFLVFT